MKGATETVEFNCLRCGSCCHEYEFADGMNFKRIPVFPEELDELEVFAKENGILIKFLEDVVFPDIKNKRIIVVTYRIVLEGSEKCCPFFQASRGCLVNEIKPLACKAYPLAQKKIDAYTQEMYIDPYCRFIEGNEIQVKNAAIENIKSLFASELDFSARLMKKNQEIILKLKQLTVEGKILIPEKVSTNDMDIWLRTWDRAYIKDY
ncbi:MAG: YkgJ family cysteine cluster protein [Candidatus Sigynarchaeota archaeon]